jgi:molecular chaperone GrpE (heat shock protein)
MEQLIGQKVNYRIKEDYIAEDGRHIEAWKKVGSIPKASDGAEEIEKIEQENMFYGVLLIGTQFGPKEIKFALSKANTLEEAFAIYNETAQSVVKELEKRQEELKKAHANKIVTAPAGVLDELEK